MTSTTSSKRVALVTGATSGIGEATAKLLAAKGWRVVVSGRRAQEGEKVVKDIVEAGGEAAFVHCDITDENSVKQLVEKTVEIYGRIDGGVNNAGYAADAAPLAEQETQQFQDMLQVNVLGLFWCMKYQLKHMVAQKTGSIVNLASIAGLNGIAGTSTYSATKHAVVGLTKSAAIDYATSGVTINAVAPGAIKTDIYQYAIDAGVYTEEQIASMMPMARLGAPADIAQAIEFLLNNKFATGTILSVDGGFNAR